MVNQIKFLLALWQHLYFINSWSALKQCMAKLIPLEHFSEINIQSYIRMSIHHFEREKKSSQRNVINALHIGIFVAII